MESFGQGSGTVVGFRKALKEEIVVLPFVWPLREVKFKPHDREVPDELRVEITENQLHISGTKKSDTKKVLGREVGKYGKLALLPAVPRSGSLIAKIQTINDVNEYGISLELASGALKSEAIKLEPNTNYSWTAELKGNDFVITVSKNGEVLNSVSSEAATVKSFGFNASVRHPGSKADIAVTVDAVK